MRPLTLEKPKPLLEVLGRPLLAHIIESLPADITEIILVVGYKGDMIKEHFGAEFQGRKISYVEQKKPLGTGDALMACKPLVAGEKRFLVVYADDIHDKQAIGRAVRQRERAIFVARVKYPERFGIVVTDERGRATGLEEAPKEPKTDLAATGAYLLTPDIFDYPPLLEENGEYFINSMLLPYMRDREVFAETEDLWLPVGYPEDLKRAAAALRSHEN